MGCPFRGLWSVHAWVLLGSMHLGLSPFTLSPPQYPLFRAHAPSHLLWKTQVPEVPHVRLPSSVTAIVQAWGSAPGWKCLPPSHLP